MTKLYLFVLAGALLFTSQAAQAQQKKLTVEDAVLKGRTMLAPARLNQLQWVPQTKKYAYVAKVNKKDVLVIGEAGKNGVDSVLTTDMLLASIQKIDTSVKEMKSFPGLTFTSAANIRFLQGSSYYCYNLASHETKKLHSLPAGTAGHDYHNTKELVAYTADNNLFISQGDGTRLQVTNDANKGIVNGQSVHRNEFGITKGTFWNNSGSHLAFYRMDESMVSEYPIYELGDTPATVRMIRYPTAGSKSHHVTVGVYNLATRQTVFLQTGEPAEQYLTNIAWSPDDKYIFIAVVNRAQNHMWLKQFDAASGAFVKTLFEETHPKWVEPEHPMLFVKDNPGQFIWQSERDGYNHLYLYNINGSLVRQLTKGPWMVTDVYGFTSDDQLLIGTTTSSPLNRDLASVNVKNGKVNIQKNTGLVHTPILSADQPLLIDQYTGPSIPRNIVISTTGFKDVQILQTAENPLKEYHLGRTIQGILNPGNGRPELYTRLILPPGYDSTRKYPALIYLYGGPHLQLITNSWLCGADLWLHYMAQQGFIVFSLDNRGSANRGLEFENAVHGKLGTYEMEDQLSGLQFLKTFPAVDSTRIGVYGWSFGGFLTTSLMTRNPGKFQVAVAGGPVIDWSLYEIMYTERYMDTPQENPEGYNANNLLNHIDSLQGKLMLIHGTSDDVVLWQHSLLYIKKCVEKRKQLDYFVYPGHLHNVLGPDRVHLLEKVANYFIDNLKP